MIWNFKIIFAKNSQGRPLRPYLLIRLVITAKITYFQDQTSLRAVKSITLPIFHHFFSDPKLWDHFCQKFIRTSVKALSMKSIGHHDQNNLFSRSNESRESRPPFYRFSYDIVHHIFRWSKILRSVLPKIEWMFVKTLFMEWVGHHGQNDQFSRSNEPRESKPPIMPI